MIALQSAMQVFRQSRRGFIVTSHSNMFK